MFTPGPWTLKDERHHFIIPEIHWEILRSHSTDTERDAEIRISLQGQTETANAYLVAAAPELLEALEIAVQRIRFWLDQQECDCPDIYHTCGRYDRERELERMQAAIKKARGE